jgi:hypothetical protein
MTGETDMEKETLMKIIANAARKGEMALVDHALDVLKHYNSNGRITNIMPTERNVMSGSIGPMGVDRGGLITPDQFADQVAKSMSAYTAQGASMQSAQTPKVPKEPLPWLDALTAHAAAIVEASEAGKALAAVEQALKDAKRNVAATQQKVDQTKYDVEYALQHQIKSLMPENFNDHTSLGLLSSKLPAYSPVLTSRPLTEALSGQFLADQMRLLVSQTQLPAAAPSA